MPYSEVHVISMSMGSEWPIALLAQLTLQRSEVLKSCQMYLNVSAFLLKVVIRHGKCWYFFVFIVYCNPSTFGKPMPLFFSIMFSSLYYKCVDDIFSFFKRTITCKYFIKTFIFAGTMWTVFHFALLAQVFGREAGFLPLWPGKQAGPLPVLKIILQKLIATMEIIHFRSNLSW